MQTRNFLVLLRYFLGVQRAASLSVGAGAALEWEALCQGHIVQGFSFPVLKLGVIYKFLKMRSLFRAITQLPLNILPTFFLMLWMVSCFKWDSTNSGDMLFCTFFHVGNVKEFLQLGVHLKSTCEENLWLWLQIISSTVYCILVFLGTRQIHSVCVCLESLTEQRE